MTTPERECDVVMKGGITSGVAYAGLLAELGSAFRLRCLGGTSAGAIGAAVAAAAELRRQRGDDRPFAELIARPTEQLATPGFMASLLQPVPAARPAIEALLALLRAERGSRRRAWDAVLVVMRARWWAPVGATVAVIALGRLAVSGGSSWAAAALITLAVVVGGAVAVIGPAALLARAVRRVLSAPENRFGLCSGRGVTEWLHATLQEVSGVGDRPLTFGDLEDAGIHLAMVTTDLGSATALRLPTGPGNPRYAYDPADIEVLFPAAVAAAMSGAGLVPLPSRDLPVVVAVRMSLGMPLLFSAVPLHPISGRRPSGDVRTWLADGGITSNFPIGFFDAWLPRRPTFGLDLRPGSHGPRVTLPGPDDPPRQRWSDVPDVATLVRQIADAVQNWRDTAQADLPGFRDRVCQISLRPGEGGLHLNMSEETIRELMGAGRDAGGRLASAFDGPGLRRHRARRFVTLMRELQAGLGDFSDSLPLTGVVDADLPSQPAYRPPFLQNGTRAAEALAAFQAQWRSGPDAVDFEASDPPDPPVSLRIGPGT